MFVCVDSSRLCGSVCNIGVCVTLNKYAKVWNSWNPATLSTTSSSSAFNITYMLEWTWYSLSYNHQEWLAELSDRLWEYSYIVYSDCSVSALRTTFTAVSSLPSKRLSFPVFHCLLRARDAEKSFTIKLNLSIVRVARLCHSRLLKRPCYCVCWGWSFPTRALFETMVHEILSATRVTN